MTTGALACALHSLLYAALFHRQQTACAEAHAHKPVKVALMTGHYMGVEYAKQQEACHLHGRPLPCIWTEDKSQSQTADVLWYHAPHCDLSCSQKANNRSAKQLSVVCSLESSRYYSNLNNHDYMGAFDIEMTYRLCSTVPAVYFSSFKYEELPNTIFSDPLPFAEKRTAIAFVNSNCHTPSKRTELIAQLMKVSALPVHSFGHCLRNQRIDGRGDKINIFRMYKFCISVENSVDKDYVTEKLYQAFVAGCVPIYYGAPNVADFLPAPNSIIDYRQLGSSVRLARLLSFLSINKDAYERRLTW
eukprot:CAMPEP_0202860778 /NCGR_PEP_ID=MMETSP1391-20130828/2376_1 /ASSEMBLY_ACC=CAM_ASM_000867 /TAXON_ID=1034604 /ORGANISM="Chlamydomonas leiostraca, Strain SAG 11-49" /LENGTH=302 /DNA_ID=CAMNT_0049540021 /DNA_START=243 /DNA_END=1148 /DNA_ORIENTATION=-